MEHTYTDALDKVVTNASYDIHLPLYANGTIKAKEVAMASNWLCEELMGAYLEAIGFIHARVWWTFQPVGRTPPDFDKWMHPVNAVKEFGEPTSKTTSEWQWY